MKAERGVLFISALDAWSMGAGRGGPALYRTLTGYAERGWQVYFITGNRAPGDGTEIHENVHVTRFDFPWLRRALRIRRLSFLAHALWWLLFQITAIVHAVRITRRHRIDVVYGYEIHGMPAAKVVARLRGVPLVARYQGTILGLVWMKRPLWRIRAWEHVLGLRIPADLVIMTNDGSQGDRVLENLGADMERVRFWMNGLDRELFSPVADRYLARQELRITSQYVLLSVSRLISLKGVHRSIRALPEVLYVYPDCLLLIVGDGPERERLEQLAADLGVARHVRFEGAVPHSAVPTYLAAADLFLSLYDWSNVGNPLLEAMMAGKCIVTLNNGDTGRFILNEVNGVLLEYQDLPRLSEVIKDLLGDEERRARLGANARKFAEGHFWTWDQRIDAEIQQVSALLESWRKP